MFKACHIVYVATLTEAMVFSLSQTSAMTDCIKSNERRQQQK